MARVASALARDFSQESRGWGQSPVRDFSPDAEKFPKQVLVIDDEPLIRWSVSQSLGELGYEVSEAPDAATALKMVTTSPLPFQSVVLDLRLPDMHDLSLLGTLRQLLPSARLIVMTAYGTPEIIDDARAIGAAVMLKPFELTELTRLLRDDDPPTGR